jgi:hypothetical protein
MAPSSDRGHDPVGIGGPDDRLRTPVMLSEQPVDGALRPLTDRKASRVKDRLLRLASGHNLGRGSSRNVVNLKPITFHEV